MLICCVLTLEKISQNHRLKNGEIITQKKVVRFIETRLRNSIFRKLTFFLSFMIQTRYNQVLEPSKSECS